MVYRGHVLGMPRGTGVIELDDAGSGAEDARRSEEDYMIIELPCVLEEPAPLVVQPAHSRTSTSRTTSTKTPRLCFSLLVSTSLISLPVPRLRGLSSIAKILGRSSG